MCRRVRRATLRCTVAHGTIFWAIWAKTKKRLHNRTHGSDLKHARPPSCTPWLGLINHSLVRPPNALRPSWPRGSVAGPTGAEATSGSPRKPPPALPRGGGPTVVAESPPAYAGARASHTRRLTEPVCGRATQLLPDVPLGGTTCPLSISPRATLTHACLNCAFETWAPRRPVTTSARLSRCAPPCCETRLAFAHPATRPTCGTSSHEDAVALRSDRQRD
jgi:hypothetical protein